MRKIASILIVIFLTVQVAPAICSLFSSETSLFMVDEEKSSEKIDIGYSKEIKEYYCVDCSVEGYTQKVNTAFHLSDKIQLHPSIELLTPPPNVL